MCRSVARYKFKWLSSAGAASFASSLAAIALGLLAGFAILLISNSSMALQGFATILNGGFARGAKSFGLVLYQATPIIFTGLAFAFAAKAGLFNIGMPGQFVIGAFCAIYASVNFSLPAPLRWIACILAAMASGALWAAVPGLLKAVANVNEVISCIMMNYIGMYLANMLIVKSNIYNAAKNLTVAPGVFIPTYGMEKLFVDSGANIGIFVSLGVAILCWGLLQLTPFGYELKVCGLNRHAAKYAGINEMRCIVAAMAIAGALAGAGGGFLYLSNAGKYMTVVDVLASEGFNGIPVALLALNNPIGVFFSGIFIAYINVGGLYLQRYGYVPEIINIVISVIIYCSALSSSIGKLLFERKGVEADL